MADPRRSPASSALADPPGRERRPEGRRPEASRPDGQSRHTPPVGSGLRLPDGLRPLGAARASARPVQGF